MQKLTIEALRKAIPEYAVKATEVILSHGKEAYLVGGAVRDIALGRTPKDYDLATNALPDEIDSYFEQSININKKFGTILVLIKDEHGETNEVEVTTYRLEEQYYGGRWPGKVNFSSRIVDDLARRDLTINAIAIDMGKLYGGDASIEEIVVDPFQGIDDLGIGVVRAVGNPIDRYTEDGLRAFKACRIASELDFSIDELTMDAISKCLDIAAQISMERIRDEFDKLLKYSVRPSKGIELLRVTGLLKIFLPELLSCEGVVQPEWHSDDVYWHSLKCVDLAEDGVKMAALLHDIGKPATISTGGDGKIHFYSHDVVGAEMAKQILKRMRYPAEFISKVSNLVRWHMFYYPSAQWREGKELNLPGGWSDSAIRRFVKNIGGVDVLTDLFKLRIADAGSNGKSDYDPSELDELQDRIAVVMAGDVALKVTDLHIKGEDLMGMGLEGRQIGEMLNKLLEMVIDDPGLNNIEQLTEQVRNLIINK